MGAIHRAFDKPANVGLTLRQFALKQVEPADDDGEHVVEVVRDTAGQLPYGLHLLCLAQLLLCL